MYIIIKYYILQYVKDNEIIRCLHLYIESQGKPQLQMLITQIPQVVRTLVIQLSDKVSNSK